MEMKLKILCLINNEHDKEIVNKCKKNTKNKTKINKTFGKQPLSMHNQILEWTDTTSQSLFGQHFTDFISVIHVHLLPVKYHQYFAA